MVQDSCRREKDQKNPQTPPPPIPDGGGGGGGGGFPPIPVPPLPIPPETNDTSPMPKELPYRYGNYDSGSSLYQIDYKRGSVRCKRFFS